MGSPNSKFEIIRVTLQEKDNVLTVQELCEIAGVSRSGYYNWLKTEPERQRREERDKADFELILEAYRYRGYDKGVRGIHMRLLHTGVVMNVKKICKPILLTSVILTARRCWISFTVPTQNPMSAIPKKLVTVSRSWRSICVYCPWIITTQFSICVAVCAVHMNAKPSWMACNTALS